MRNQAIITPACGLATHGATQAERALRLAAEMAERSPPRAPPPA